MNGSANAAWITWESTLLGPAKKYGGCVKNSRGGAPGGAPAARKRRAGAFPKVPMLFAPIRRSASLREAKGRHRAKARKREQDGLTFAGTRRAEPEACAHST